MSKPELHPIPIHSPWHNIGIDFVGPISPVSRVGNQYILTTGVFQIILQNGPVLLLYHQMKAHGVADVLFKVCTFFIIMVMCII